MKKIVYTVLVGLLALTACTVDSYDKGEGKYSLMQAELVDLNVNAQKAATSFVTDEGDRYQLSPPITSSWFQTADTIYRAILYFNALPDATAEAVSLGVVPTLRATEHWKLEKQPEDPIGMESAWLSKTRKYINLGLLLKTGQVDGEDGTHTIGLAQDTIIVNDDQTCTAYFRFLHDQADIPEHYTSRRYVSILLPDTVQLDTIRLTIPTYEGKVERIFLP